MLARTVVLPAAHDMSLGMRRWPRLPVSNTAICTTVVGGKQGKGRDGDLLAVRSVGGGKSWAGPVPVNGAADSARESLHALSASEERDLLWLDLRNGNTEVLACRRDGRHGGAAKGG